MGKKPPLIIRIMIHLAVNRYRMPNATYRETAVQLAKWWFEPITLDEFEDHVFHDLCPTTLDSRIVCHEIARYFKTKRESWLSCSF